MIHFLFFCLCAWIALAFFTTMSDDESVTGVEKIVVVIVVAVIVMTLFK